MLNTEFHLQKTEKKVSVHQSGKHKGLHWDRKSIEKELIIFFSFLLNMFFCIYFGTYMLVQWEKKYMYNWKIHLYIWGMHGRNILLIDVHN